MFKNTFNKNQIHEEVENHGRWSCPMCPAVTPMVCRLHLVRKSMPGLLPTSGSRVEVQPDHYLQGVQELDSSYGSAKYSGLQWGPGRLI